MNCLHKKIGAPGGHTFTACACTGSACTAAKRCMAIKSDIIVYINMHGDINSGVCAYDGQYYGNILFNHHAFICTAIK